MTSGEELKLIGRRYQLVEKLGEGGMGEVYRALDRLTGQELALKQVTVNAEDLLFNSRSRSTDFRLALAQEFKTLASLRHPNIISVLDYGFDAERQPYFTMDFLQKPRSILAAGAERTIDTKINLLVQMLQALAYLHRRGILHRDLKPDNVLVITNDLPGEGQQVKVLDFGLAVAAKHYVETSDVVVGTLPYMAPEVLKGEAPTEAADLYAVGVMAYQLFAGRHPYNLNDMTQLIQDVAYTPVDISEVDVEEAIGVVLQRLLAKTPDSRYPSANQVIIALCDAVKKTVPSETAAIRESFLQSAQFVGRDTELAVLVQSLASIFKGQGAAWLVGGESGSGKSRLIDELRTRALVDGAQVLRGQAVSEGGSPYHLWRDMLRWLSLQNDLTDNEASTLKLLVQDISTLQQREIPDFEPLEPAEAQEQLVLVVEALLRRQKQPLVMILEDLHWVGSESIALLQRLNAVVTELPLMLIGSYRDDERAELPQDLPEMQILKLARLDAAGIAALSESMLGAVGLQENVIKLFERESEGNVFFMVEVARVLAEVAGQMDQIGKKTLPQRIFAGGMALVIRRRLQRVPEEARLLLQMAAVAGRQLDLAILRHAAPIIGFDALLTRCSEIAVLDVQEGRWRFAHDKLREAVLMDIADEQRRALHRQVAEAVETIYPDDQAQFAVLSYHWREAQNDEKETYYAAKAGEYSAQNGANLEAKGYFEQALDSLARLPQTQDRQRQFVDISVRLSKAGANFRSEALLPRLQKALEVAEALGDEERQARMLSSLGAFFTGFGRTGEAMGYFSRALALAEKLQIPELLLLPYNMVGRAVTVSGDLPKAEYMLSRGIALAEQFNDTDLLAGSTGWYGYVLALQGRRTEGESYAKQCLDLARERGHKDQIANSLLIVGTIEFYCGAFEAALERLTECLEIAQEAQSPALEYNAAGNLCGTYLGLGDVNKAAQQLERCLKLAAEIRLMLSLPLFQAYQAELYLLNNEWEKAQTQIEQALSLADATRQFGVKVEVLRIKGKIHAANPSPDWEAAEECFQQSLEASRRGNIQVFIPPCLLELGRLYSHRGLTDQARAVFQEAKQMFERLNMRRHLDLVNKALAAL